MNDAPDQEKTRTGRWRPNQHVYMSLIAIVIGILGGYGAVLFRLVIKATQYLFYHNTRDILTFIDTMPAYLIIGLPALGGLIVGPLVYFGAREAKGHGVPEVMEAVALRGGYIRPRVAIVKILASAICISSGGSVGREGPIVQIGSSIGSTLAQILKSPASVQRTLVGCGAAAGIAATFNAPIAGALFAVEIILGDFGLATFSPVVLASVTATTISRHYFGDFPAFIIPTYKLVSLWEFALYPVLGIAAGFIALLFIGTLYKSEDVFNAIRIPEYLKPVIGGLILGLLLLQWPHVFGVGYGAINKSLTDGLPALLLLMLVFVKILATSVTIGSGGSGGIFAPSLFIGSMFGGFFGFVVHTAFPQVTADPGAYALVAMGALVAGTTHAPITAILIIFELTDSYDIILPLMIACIISTILTTSLKQGSIYTIKLARRGVLFHQGREQRVLQAMKIRNVMNDFFPTISDNTPLMEIIDYFKSYDVSYLHVINQNGALTGVISFSDLRQALQEAELEDLVVAADLATRDLVTINPSDNLLTALQKMGEKGISQLPVVAENDPGKIVGTVNQKDLLNVYNRAVLQGNEDDFCKLPDTT